MTLKDKNFYRDEVLKQRSLLTANNISSLSSLISLNLFKTNEFNNASTIALYSSLDGEIDTTGIFKKSIELGKKVCYPKFSEDTKELCFYFISDLNDMSLGAFKIKEPTDIETNEININTIDLVIVPGLVFDKLGSRIGFGLGCYDKALSSYNNGHITALAFKLQVKENLPSESFDVPVDSLITEEETYYINN